MSSGENHQPEDDSKSEPIHRVHLVTSTEQIIEYTRGATLRGRVVLVPVDFSEHSEAALVYAAEIAQLMHASLVVLHVMHDPGDMPGYYSRLIKQKRTFLIQETAVEVFGEFMQEIADRHPDRPSLVSAENLMVVGLPVTRILEVVEILEPALVVMGSQGRTGIKRLSIGSKAEQLVRLCPVPVTIVKTEHETHSPVDR